ncbi:MAG: hypothetical protein O3A36_01355 [bacterium]|nr:hypothetical protein [bacterium]
MKDDINLLPPGAQATRRERVKVRRERSFSIAAVCACLFILGVYGVIWWHLKNAKSSIEDQIIIQNKDRITISEQNKIFNTSITEIDSRIADVTLWTAYISDVVSSVPKGILISRIELVEEPETLVVTGTASLGSSVVEYQRALEALPWVDRVEAPLQNFARAPKAIAVFTIFHKKPPAL